MKALKKSMILSISLISIFTILSRALGLLRDMFIASSFGATSELDVFNAASNIPMILFMAIGTAITTTFIPLYNEKRKISKEEGIKFTNNVLNVFIIGSSIITIIFVVFSKPASSFLNPGFNENEIINTAMLTKILLPTLIFNSIIYIFNGLLQSEGNFAVPAMISLPLNMIIIIYLLLFGNKHGILGLTLITFIATACQVLPQIYAMRKENYKYKFFIDLKDPMLIKMSVMILPVILGTSVQQINSFVERAFAGGFSAGSLSTLTYSYRVFIIFVDIFAVAISTVVYPMMSKQSANNNIEEMKETLVKYISILVVFIIPVTVMVMIHSKSIIFILFERGRFTRESTTLTAGLLTFYIIGLLPYGIRDFLCKAFYTMKDTKTPMINSGFAMFINIVLIFILQRSLGINGIALANAISTCLACMLLFISLNRKLKNINNREIINSFCKTIVASVFMGFTILLSNKFLNIALDSTFIVLVKISLSSLLGTIVFIVSGYILNITQIRNIIMYINNRKISK